MIINATQIRVGNILVIDGELYRVTWVMHRTPGKGPASMQTKLKNILNGKNLEHRFASSDKAERADLETRQMQYLYDDGEGLVFMDNENFEQSTVSKDLLSDGTDKFLEEGSSYAVTFHEITAVGLELPNTVELKVTFAPPEIKKATATSQLRAVTCEKDITVQAPPFIKEGDVIRINTDSGEYLERVN
jgi:elongation factor P